MGPVRKNVTEEDGLRDLSTKRGDAAKAAGKSQANAIRQHHEELAEWRAFKHDAKATDKVLSQKMGMRFIADHPASEFIPAALTKLSALARQDDTSVRVSDFLQDQAKRLPSQADRILARRLSYKALAKEGRSSEALAGLEIMMETAATPQDSIRALIGAMGVYSFDRGQSHLEPRYPQIRSTDIKDLAHRVFELARIMDDPNLQLHGRGVLLP